jgi:hypothetical protein
LTEVLGKYFHKQVLSPSEILDHIYYQKGYVSIDKLQSIEIFKVHVIILLLLDIFHVNAEVLVNLALSICGSVSINCSSIIACGCIHSKYFSLLDIVVENVVLDV